jgi:hypothetical protein
MRRSLLLVVALVLLAGCGDDGGGSTAEEDDGDVQTTPLTFGDGDEVWLRVETGGGFVPVIYNLRQTPSLLLFDDGRLLRRTNDTDEVQPAFEQVQLDEFQTAELLDRFDAVVDGPDVGDPPVTDLATTTITTQDGELGIYALDWTDGLSDDEVAARQAAVDAIDAAFAFDGAEPFEPEGWFLLTEGGTCEPVDDVSGLGLAEDTALQPVLTGEERCVDGYVQR